MTKSANQNTLPDGYTPSEDEEYMNPQQLAYFKQKLLDWKSDIVDQTKTTIDFLKGESVSHPDPADTAAANADRQLELRARDRQRKLINKINQALQRVEDGEYGFCVETGDPIGLKRLDARPIATLSIEAQEMHERSERVSAG